MRVAHIDQGTRAPAPPNLRRQATIHPPRVADSVLERNGLPPEPRRAHVDPVGPGPSRSHAITPASVSILTAPTPSSRHKKIGDATRAVAAGAGQRAVIVVDQHVGRGPGVVRVAENHHLVVAEAWRAMDSARVFRRRAVRSNPACRERGSRCRRRSCAQSCDRRADGGRSSPSSFGRSGGLAPLWRADLSIARAPSRSRRRATRHRQWPRRRRSRRGFCCVRGRRRGAALLLERRQRALPEGNLVDASPAEMRVHPGHDHRGAVLRLERERALDPEHERRRTGGRVGIAFGGSRRPLQFDRPGVTRERFTDNGWPIGDQACFA